MNLTVELEEKYELEVKRQRFNCYMEGAERPFLVSASPEYDVCRRLVESKVRGRVSFVWRRTGSNGFSMDIERGAKLATSEPDAQVVRIIKFRKFGE